MDFSIIDRAGFTRRGMKPRDKSVKNQATRACPSVLRRFEVIRRQCSKKSIANRRAACDLTIDNRCSRDAYASLAEPRMAIEKKFRVEALPAAANAINRTLVTTGIKLDE
jgi:hypothetical protein